MKNFKANLLLVADDVINDDDYMDGVVSLDVSMCIVRGEVMVHVFFNVGFMSTKKPNSLELYKCYFDRCRLV